MFAKLSWTMNALFRKIAYRDFVRHPEVNDYQTNINVGQGYGLARTIDPLTQVFRVLRYSGVVHVLFRKNFSILDLGCGDGFMLSGFDFAGFRNLSGIEIDRELADLASRNVPRATIFCVDFSSSEFSWILGENSYKAVFAFNPAPAEQLISALRALLENGPYTLFLRNPKSWPEIVSEKHFGLEVLGTPPNMVVARVFRKLDQN